ncbi:MAG TPA: RDD family protein [Thermoleophilia bacterium]|nr:RDD family protein [Thermoleophilia bacterium]
MQQAHVQERVEVAGLGSRAAAVMVDTLIVLVGYSVTLAIAARAGWGQLAFMKNMTIGDISTASRSAPGWFMPVMYALVFVYFTLFELRGWTPGKRIFRLQVARDDGTPASPASIIVRNLVRIPEMLLYYVPSGISCLASPRNKRIGDYAGGTVVLRRSPAAAGAAASAAFGAGQPATAPPAPLAAGHAAQSPAAAPGVDDALAALKTAALAVRGAHLNYLRFSERELAREPGAAEYTPEYEAAWYTLADAVMALQRAYAEATVAATVAGTSIPEQGADQPDLTYLLGELAPYFAAGSDEEVHEAYLRVARSEAPA